MVVVPLFSQEIVDGGLDGLNNIVTYVIGTVSAEVGFWMSEVK